MRSFKRPRFEILVSMGCLTMLCYLGWQAFYSQRGYAYRDQLLARVETLTNQLGEIDGQRRLFETQVALMRPESIDPDMLDELVRKNLNMVRPTDVIIEFPK